MRGSSDLPWECGQYRIASFQINEEPMKKTNLVLLAISAGGAALIMGAGIYLAQPAAAAISSVVLLAAVGVGLRSSQKQWLLAGSAVALLLAFTFLTYPFGILWGSATICLALYLASLSVRSIYGGSLVDAAEATLRLLTNQPIATQVIQEPGKLVDRGSAEKTGPLRLTIKPNAAVVLVSGPTQTRIEGPASVDTRAHEYVACVFSLSPQHRMVSHEKVLTSDLMTTEVKLAVTYGLAVSQQAREGSQKLSAAEIQAIEVFHGRSANHSEEFSSVLESLVHEIVGAQELDACLATALRQQMGNELRNRLRRIVERWGLHVYRLTLVSIQPDRLVSKARQERWLARTNAETIMQYEQAKAQAWGQALQILGSAYEEVRDNNVPTTVIFREMLRRILDQASIDASTRGMVPRQLGRLLEELAGDDETPPTPP